MYLLLKILYTICEQKRKSFILKENWVNKISQFKLEETSIDGCFLLYFSGQSDGRGNFYRRYCESEFLQNGLNTNWVQTNLSSNFQKGTLRGFHFQRKPFEEVKLVSCSHGKIQDVIIDLRPDSNTYLKHFSIELSSDSNVSIYIARGVAHAYLTLEDDSSVLYQVSERYSKDHASGATYLDPKINVTWSVKPTIVSEADLSWDFI